MSNIKHFEEHIQEYLTGFAKGDSHFMERFSLPNKSITECCNYIIGEVKKANTNYYDPDKVYQLARHYYLEDIDAKDVKTHSARVVVPDAKKASQEKEVSTIPEKKKETKETPKKVVKNPKPKKEEPAPNSYNIFDLLEE